VALRCPECGGSGLRIQATMELGPDHRSDERSIQALRCPDCGLTAVGMYEESRRGALDSESWSHTGYPAGVKALAALKRLVRSCPAPKDPRCKCAAHRQLDQAVGGDDSILPGVEWSRPFGIQLTGRS